MSEQSKEEPGGKYSSQLPAVDEDYRLTKVLERAEGFVYLGVAVVFLIVAVAVLVYSVVVFPVQFQEEGFPPAITTLINDLLLVVIVLEILRTLLGFLQSHTLSLHPFLVIAAISATRRILTIGAGMAIEQDLPQDEFNRAIVDLLTNAGVVLAVAVALYLTRLGDTHEEKPGEAPGPNR